VVDHKRQSLDINATRGDIRGHHELHALLFEGTHHLVALLLHEIALQDIDRQSERDQFAVEFVRASLGAAENETASLLALQKIGDERGLVLALADRKTVVDVAVHDVRLVDLDRVRASVTCSL
jgi:hypothetical protein